VNVGLGRRYSRPPRPQETARIPANPLLKCAVLGASASREDRGREACTSSAVPVAGPRSIVSFSEKRDNGSRNS
jgi:hypothetical protein